MSSTHLAADAAGPDSRLRLILFGGGHGDDFREPEVLLGEWAGTDGNVLQIVAPGQHPVDTEREAARTAAHLREAGVPHLTIWDASVIETPGFVPDLTPFTGVILSATLPHEIMPMLRASGLDHALVDAAHSGTVLYASNLLLPMLGPDIRYTALRDYWTGDHGIDDDTGLGLTTDNDGHPTIYMGRYRGLPSGDRRHPQRVANETRARVCVIPPAGMVTIRNGEVRAIGRRTFAWYDPKPHRRGQRTILKGSRHTDERG